MLSPITTYTEEQQRIIELAELDLDYTNLDESFNDLVKLAAYVAGTEISLINLIDAYTQWTISGHGFPIGQRPREKTVCQFTIDQSEQFEVKDLGTDERFKNMEGIIGEPYLRYYFGIPLKTKKGHHIGALCVLDTQDKSLPQEKIDLLKIISEEIVNRLSSEKAIQSLQYALAESRELIKRTAHDIRGPIGGVLGLTQHILQKGDQMQQIEILKLIKLIQNSSSSVLDLAAEILDNGGKESEDTLQLQEHEMNLGLFKSKLEELYQVQAENKAVQFDVVIHPADSDTAFSKNKLMQIAGNLISNSFKFTPPLGSIAVKLDLRMEHEQNWLRIEVSDNGIGLSTEQIGAILQGKSASTLGTTGERGYGLGLQLVKYLLDGLQGTMRIDSQPGEGTTFYVNIPVG